jgi:hypothetical protein
MLLWMLGSNNVMLFVIPSCSNITTITAATAEATTTNNNYTLTHFCSLKHHDDCCMNASLHRAPIRDGNDFHELFHCSADLANVIFDASKQQSNNFPVLFGNDLIVRLRDQQQRILQLISSGPNQLTVFLVDVFQIIVACFHLVSSEMYYSMQQSSQVIQQEMLQYKPLITLVGKQMIDHYHLGNVFVLNTSKHSLLSALDPIHFLTEYLTHLLSPLSLKHVFQTLTLLCQDYNDIGEIVVFLFVIGFLISFAFMAIYDAYTYFMHGNKNGVISRLIEYCTRQQSVQQGHKHKVLKKKLIRRRRHRRFICLPTIVESEHEDEIEEEVVLPCVHRLRHCARVRRSFVRLPTIVELKNEDTSDPEAVPSFVRRLESENEEEEAMFESQQKQELGESELENEERCQEEVVVQVNPQLRRSTRLSKPPSRYNMYECYVPRKKRN